MSPPWVEFLCAGRDCSTIFTLQYGLYMKKPAILSISCLNLEPLYTFCQLQIDILIDKSRSTFVSLR